MVNFSLDGNIAHGNRLVELGGVMKKVTVVGLVAWKVRVICKSMNYRTSIK